MAYIQSRLFCFAGSYLLARLNLFSPTEGRGVFATPEAHPSRSHRRIPAPSWRQ